MRIGIDARFYGSVGKGLGRYTQKLIEHLEAVDHDNDYVVFLLGENFAEYVPKNPRFKKVVAQYTWYGFAEQILFVVLLLRHSLDLMHFPHFNVPILYPGKFVVTIHDLILVHFPTIRNTTRFPLMYQLKFFAYRMVIASAIRRSLHVITVSHFTEADILARYPVARGKVSVTYEAADDYCQFLPLASEERLFSSLGLRKETQAGNEEKSPHDIIRPYFLYVGNAYPHKNLPFLLSVAADFPEHVWVFVGREDFFYRRLREEARRAGIGNIVFAGFLDDAELSALYRRARAYVFPSLYEGFGLPPLEAMTRGTPVVSSDRGSLPEILGEAALYFDPTDKESLIRSLKLIENDDTLRKRLKERGYTQSAHFRFRDMANATCAIYQSVLTQRSKKTN